MHAERRANGVNLLPPARTTRMNGGPRPATVRPLPPFRHPATDRSVYSALRQALPHRVATDTVRTAPGGAAPLRVDRAIDEIPAGSGLEVDDFPLDAFIIPEGMDHLPAGMEEADRRQRQRASELADRLEALAWRLRREGYSALARQTAHGDPVDALIAGILAGYLGRL